MKKIVKRIFFIFILILTLPLTWITNLFKWWFNSSYMFHFFAELLSLLPVHLGVYARAVFYHHTLKKSPYNLVTLFGAIITQLDTVIDDQVVIGGRATIGLCRIGHYTNIGNGTTILSGRHHHRFEESDKIMEEPAQKKQVFIGNYTFIGDNCIIMDDIGDYAIVGAGSVVVKPVEAYMVAVGNPAKCIKKRKLRNSDLSLDARPLKPLDGSWWFELKSIIKKAVRKCYASIEYVVAVKSLSDVKSLNEPARCEIKIIEYTGKDLVLIEDRFGKQIADKFRRREKTSKSFLIFSHSALVGYFWASASPVMNEGMPPFVFDIIPEKGAVCLYDGFIARENRQSGMMSYFLSMVMAQLSQQGFKTAFLLFNSTNKSMIAVTGKLQMKVNGVIRYKKIMTYEKKDFSGLRGICELNA